MYAKIRGPRRRASWLFWISCALVCQGGIVAAQSVDARTLAKRGIEEFRNHRYERAIQQFQASLALEPKAELLFDIAQAHRLLAHCLEAQRYYQRYLEAGADAAHRLKAEKRIAEMERCQHPGSPADVSDPADLNGDDAAIDSANDPKPDAPGGSAPAISSAGILPSAAARPTSSPAAAGEATPAVAPSSSAPPPSLATSPPAAPAAASSQPTAKSALLETVDRSPPKRPIYRRWWFWTTAAAVAAVAAGAIAIGVTQTASHERSFQVHVQ